MIMNEESVLKFNNVNFAYEADRTILENINFEIPRGDFACIVGPNGGGKTTILKLILGLIKPVNGSVEVFGKKPDEIREKVGYVPQFSKFDSGFPVSVLDVVLMGCLSKNFWWGRYSKKQRAMALTALDSVGLGGFEHSGFADLSGGQRQRAMIARAIMGEPELLLLDEPTASVDVKGTEQLYNMFAEMNKKFTIIIVSHDIGFVSAHVKTVVCVRKTLQIHPVSELTGESLQKLYGPEVNIVRHDHRCSEKGHVCHHS